MSSFTQFMCVYEGGTKTEKNNAFVCLSVLLCVSFCRSSATVAEYNEAATQLNRQYASKRSMAGEDHIFSSNICKLTRADLHNNALFYHTI